MATIAGCAAGIVIGLRFVARRRTSPRPPSPRGPIDIGDGSFASESEIARGAQLDTESDAGLLSATLRDIRDAAEADEAILWRWVEERDALTPMAWSTAAASRPQFFDLERWGPLARWSAQERLIHHDAEDGVRLASVPVVRGERLLGVLTLSRQSGLPAGATEEAHESLRRHARQLAVLLELGETRSAYGHQMRRNRALLDAVRRIQSHTTAESLGRALCHISLEVSSAEWAALVRWYPRTMGGEVLQVIGQIGVSTPFPVTDDALAGAVCIEGLPVVLDDASGMHPAAHLFAVGERIDRLGSVAIVPLATGGSPIGALLIGGAQPYLVTHDAADRLMVLAAVAAASLSIAWEVEEVSRTARTDALTGLANRREFDLQLERVLSETDRFGGRASLVLVDLDHFKKVNDTHGHDAGDAVLKAVARTLVEGAREVDICARFGGEELAILLPQTSTDGAIELAERLRVAIASRPLMHGSDEIRVTASFGVASYPGAARTRDGVFPAADKALYEAKHGGRNQVRAARLIRTGTTV